MNEYLGGVFKVLPSPGAGPAGPPALPGYAPGLETLGLAARLSLLSTQE